MLPRPGSTRGDSRRLEGTTAWLERDDRQRLSARSPLPSLLRKSRGSGSTPPPPPPPNSFYPFVFANPPPPVSTMSPRPHAGVA